MLLTLNSDGAITLSERLSRLEAKQSVNLIIKLWLIAPKCIQMRKEIENLCNQETLVSGQVAERQALGRLKQEDYFSSEV